MNTIHLPVISHLLFSEGRTTGLSLLLSRVCTVPVIGQLTLYLLRM